MKLYSFKIACDKALKGIPQGRIRRDGTDIKMYSISGGGGLCLCDPHDPIEYPINFTKEDTEANDWHVAHTWLMDHPEFDENKDDNPLMEEKRKCYVTDAWRTKGIRVVFGELVPTLNGEAIHGKSHFLRDSVNRQSYYGNDYWVTEEDAIGYVQEQIKRKIEASEKELAKLRSIDVHALVTVTDVV
jgi:hypothetical protein